MLSSFLIFCQHFLPPFSCCQFFVAISVLLFIIFFAVAPPSLFSNLCIFVTTHLLRSLHLNFFVHNYYFFFFHIVSQSECISHHFFVGLFSSSFYILNLHCPFLLPLICRHLFMTTYSSPSLCHTVLFAVTWLWAHFCCLLPFFLFSFSVLSFSTISLFSRAKLWLSNSQVFVRWEGVELASYLLIYFWFTRLLENKRSLKALLLIRNDYFGLYYIVSWSLFSTISPSYSGVVLHQAKKRIFELTRLSWYDINFLSIYVHTLVFSNMERAPYNEIFWNQTTCLLKEPQLLLHGIIFDNLTIIQNKHSILKWWLCDFTTCLFTLVLKETQQFPQSNRDLWGALSVCFYYYFVGSSWWNFKTFITKHVFPVKLKNGSPSMSTSTKSMQMVTKLSPPQSLLDINFSKPQMLSNWAFKFFEPHITHVQDSIFIVAFGKFRE